MIQLAYLRFTGSHHCLSTQPVVDQQIPTRPRLRIQDLASPLIQESYSHRFMLMQIQMEMHAAPFLVSIQLLKCKLLGRMAWGSLLHCASLLSASSQAIKNQ